MNAFQIRWIVEGAKPRLWPSIAGSNGSILRRRLKGLANTSATSSSPISAARQDGARQQTRKPMFGKPPSPFSYRVGAALTRRLMSLFSAPSAAKSTMRARWASPARSSPRSQALKLPPFARPSSRSQQPSSPPLKSSRATLAQKNRTYLSIRTLERLRHSRRSNTSKSGAFARPYPRPASCFVQTLMGHSYRVI